MTERTANGRTEAKIEQLTYTWEIRHFSLLSSKTNKIIESPTFFMGEDQLQWKLRFYARFNSYQGRWYHVDLYLVSLGTNQESKPLDILVKCEISIPGVKTEHVFMHHYTSLSAQNSTKWLAENEMPSIAKPNDSFTMQCKIQRFMQITLLPLQRTTALTQQSPRLAIDCHNLLRESDQFKDFTIIVKGKKISVHKVFLAMRSPVFKTMFEHKELIENQTSELRIDDSEPEVVEAMLEYIYTDRVTNLSQLANGLIVVAHKYELEFLKRMCENALCDHLVVGNACKIVELASLYGSLEFKDFVNTFIVDHYSDVIASACQNIDDPVYLKKVMEWIIDLKR